MGMLGWPRLGVRGTAVFDARRLRTLETESATLKYFLAHAVPNKPAPKDLAAGVI